MTQHRRRRVPNLLPVFVGAAWLVGGSVSAWAAPSTYTVTSTADAVDANIGDNACRTAAGVCTLRAAIQESNAHNGADTISLPTGGVYKLTISGRNENHAATGDLDITDAVNITGAGASSVIIDGNGLDRVFDIDTNGTVNISGVTIRNGNPGVASGGGIQTGATLANQTVTLNLSNVVVTQNTGGVSGGGIANTDILSLTDVTVSNNTCAGTSCSGGGISNSTGGVATLNRVTLSGNSATGGGGLESDFDVNLTNVTISNNSADSGAGMQHNSGNATLVNVTISNNIATPGGGGFVNLGDATFQYTIFEHDPASETCMNLTFDPTMFTSGGHNIDVGTSCGLTGTGDLSNTDPGIAPLASNGGPTQTQALVMGSPAINAGGTDCPPPSTDQRSVSRPQPSGGRCDIGAFEHRSSDPFPTTTTSTTTSSTTTTRPPTTTTTSTTSTTTRPPTTTTSTTSTTTRPPTTTTSTTSTTSTTTTTLLCGDVNGDGVVNIGDALVIAQYTVDLRTCGLAPFGHPQVCDVNRDGGCNIGDALRMAQCSVELISCNFSCLPFSCPP